MNENCQLEFDFSPLPVFRVGCRVDGAIQLYEIPAVEYNHALRIAKAGLPPCKPLLVLAINRSPA